MHDTIHKRIFIVDNRESTFYIQKFFLTVPFVINEYLQVLRRDKKPLINQSNKQKIFLQIFKPSFSFEQKLER